MKCNQWGIELNLSEKREQQERSLCKALSSYLFIVKAHVIITREKVGFDLNVRKPKILTPANFFFDYV